MNFISRTLPHQKLLSGMQMPKEQFRKVAQRCEILSNGFVHVMRVQVGADDSDERMVNIQDELNAAWVLRLASPRDRALLLDGLEEVTRADWMSDIHVDALRQAFQLSEEQEAVLRYEYRTIPLRALMLEQQPRSGWQAVVQALKQTVLVHGAYLSIDDAKSLAISAASEMARRIPGGFLDMPAQIEKLFHDTLTDPDMGGCFGDTHPWGGGSTIRRCPMGLVEAHLAHQLPVTPIAHEALLPLLMAFARWLDQELAVVPITMSKSYEDKVKLRNAIKNAFQGLLGQSCALQDGPQIFYATFQHLVCIALDRLGFEHTHPVGTPTAEHLQQIGFVPKQTTCSPTET